MLTAVLTVAILAGAGFWAMRHDVRTASLTGPSAPVAPAAQYIYTARTANDAAITLPGVVQDHLRQAGRADQSIELDRIGYSGNVSPSVIDMTPRTGNSSGDPVLKVGGRITAAINEKITGIQTAVNSAPAAASGGRALYLGLTKINFTRAPVTIISSGIDLANPDDFRSLQWTVPTADVVAAAGSDQPALHGPVTFVLVPTAGRQPQLEQAQKNYLKSVWTGLLTAAGATSVTFIDAEPGAAGTAAPSAPTVEIPRLHSTPIPLVTGPDGVTCTVPDSYFAFDQGGLIDTAQTAQNLTPCITAALAAHATFTIDGWTSYEGPLNAAGQPATHYAYNLRLSQERVQAIARLLVSDLGVPQSDITRMTGHGDVDQPHPDPRSAANRVVVITYHVS